MNYDRPNIAIASVIICDDVRTEINGKEILIGVYNQALIVKELPFTMRLTFRVSLTLKMPDQRTCSFAVSDPDGETLLSLEGTDLPVTTLGESFVCGFAVQNITFKKEGEYNFHFGVDEPAVPTLGFKVVLPRNAEERARVGV